MSDVFPRFKNPKKRPTRKTSAGWRKVSKEVESRSRGLCEGNVEGVCPAGKHRGDHCHHIILRSQGGPDEAWNLMHLCHVAHRWAHDHPTDAAELGIIRRRSA